MDGTASHKLRAPHAAAQEAAAALRAAPGGGAGGAGGAPGERERRRGLLARLAEQTRRVRAGAGALAAGGEARAIWEQRAAWLHEEVLALAAETLQPSGEAVSPSPPRRPSSRGALDPAGRPRRCRGARGSRASRRSLGTPGARRARRPSSAPNAGGFRGADGVDAFSRATD